MMRLFAAVVISILATASAHAKKEPKPAAEQPVGTFKMVTTSDIGQPYTVIDGGCFTQQYPPITLTDGFAQTLNAAMKSAAVTGKANGADAMVGMAVSWESPTNTGQKGRVLVCGTFVKFK